MTKHVTQDDMTFRDFTEILPKIGWEIEKDWETFLDKAMITDGKNRVFAQSMGPRIVIEPLSGSTAGALIHPLNLRTLL